MKICLFALLFIVVAAMSFKVRHEDKKVDGAAIMEDVENSNLRNQVEKNPSDNQIEDDLQAEKRIVSTTQEKIIYEDDKTDLKHLQNNEESSDEVTVCPCLMHKKASTK